MEKLLKQMVDRMDVLIKLQALTAMKDWNQTQKVMALYEMDIAQSDIASILGIKSNTVTATVSAQLSKRKKSQEKKDKPQGD
jgi:DNA-binding MarR family transcriptional regulator